MTKKKKKKAEAKAKEQEEQQKQEGGETENQENQQQQQQEEVKQEQQQQQQEQEQKNTEQESQKQEQEQEKEKQEEEENKEDWESMNSEDEKNCLIWKNNMQIPLNDKLKIKIVDFGNACWEKEHFTDKIQTREYRAPEAIIRGEYTYNTDVWSLACMVFELITNNFLFKPKREENYKKNDHHLMMITETLGKIPKKFALSGKKSRKYFNKEGKLVKFPTVEENCDPIHEILYEEFRLGKKESQDIEDFLTPMLQIEPRKRVSARQALEHPWLWS